MRRSKDTTRLARLLALVPYLLANPGTSPQDVCRAFGIDRATLDADLDLLWMCGVPPYDPFALIDVDRDEKHVTISSADYFARPVSLTIGEAQALRSALAILGDLGDEGTALRRLMAKLEDALGKMAGDDSIGFATEAGSLSAVFATLKESADENVSVRITYYSASRDATTDRTIDPYRLINVGGQWYALAYCHEAQDMRLFRLDRVHEATKTAETFERRAEPDVRSLENGVLYSPSANDAAARVRFSPAAARWALETWPLHERTEAADGSVTISIPYATESWMVRQLLPHGPEARILEPSELVETFLKTVAGLTKTYSA